MIKKKVKYVATSLPERIFLNIIPSYCPNLEIKPRFNPVIKSENVSYFETINYAQLIEKAINLNVSTLGIPLPDYVSPNCDLNVINYHFPVIVSNHDLEKHPNLQKTYIT